MGRNLEMLNPLMCSTQTWFSELLFLPSSNQILNLVIVNDTLCFVICLTHFLYDSDLKIISLKKQNGVTCKLWTVNRETKMKP